mmetsp:Transcript_13642/g.32308  ORF Transcript_13642/g.32308 Transcript_13642/m.32308 type:complete len:482 (+) Transcript_13642:200-1645(+)
MHGCAKPFEAAQKREAKAPFGRSHVKAMVDLLGHTDLPLLLAQLRKHLEEKITDSKAYVDGIKEGLEPMKLPKFMYRTGGCYLFFAGKLRHFLKYQDLKPEVFQIFREIGNAVFFFKLTSDVLDEAAAHAHALTAPLFNLEVLSPLSQQPSAPEPTARAAAGPGAGASGGVMGKEGDQASASPAGSWPGVARGLLASLRQGLRQGQEGQTGRPRSEGAFVAPRVLESLGANTARCEWLYAFNSQSSSVLTKLLALVDAFLTEEGIRHEWAGTPPANGVLEVESTDDFSRLWSALAFLYCMKPLGTPTPAPSHGQGPAAPATAPPGGEAEGGELGAEEEFGHGFVLGGALFVHLLGLAGRLELLDFCGHMLKAKDHDAHAMASNSMIGMVDGATQGDADYMLVRASKLKQVQALCFALLEARLPKHPAAQAQQGNYLEFHPPAAPAAASPAGAGLASPSPPPPPKSPPQPPPPPPPAASVPT